MKKIFLDLTNYIKDVVTLRSIVLDLAKRDLKGQYAGALLGPVWIYLQPLVFTGVIYIVFTYGFRASPVSSGVPHSVWLLSGMIGWLFFANYLATSSTIIKQYGFLVKKVNFSLEVLPLVRLLSSLVPHAFFVFIALVLASVNGLYPNLYMIQIVYYFAAMSVLVIGLGWLTSATNLFVPDVAKFTQLIVQFGLWLTPIFWNKDSIPANYRWIVDLNPMTYIVDGYRESIVYGVWFWEKPNETLYFWSFAIVICIVGAKAFGRLRPHFAEVL